MDRPPEGATFAPAKLRPDGRRSPLVVAGGAAALAAAVLVGTGGRGESSIDHESPGTLTLQPATAPGRRAIAPPATAPVPAPASLVASAERDGEGDGVVVHIRLMSVQVDWLFLRVDDASGPISDTATIHLGEGSDSATAVRSTFDVRVPSTKRPLTAEAWVEVTGYDRHGFLLVLKRFAIDAGPVEAAGGPRSASLEADR